MSDNGQEVSKGSPEHGFLQWWIGTKRFIFVAVAFLLTVGLEMWWFVLTADEGLNESAGIWAEILVYLVGLARGVAWGSMALLGYWFIGYGFKEGRNMVSEVFNGRRFRAGEAKGQDLPLPAGNTEAFPRGRGKGRGKRRVENQRRLARVGRAEGSG